EPDPPGKPEFKDWSKDHVDLKWEKPANDGGAPITAYIIEKKDRDTGKWVKAAEFVMSDLEDEEALEPLTSVDITSGTVRLIVLEESEDLQWDNGGMEIQELGEASASGKRPREEGSDEEPDDGFSVVVNKKRNTRRSPPAIFDPPICVESYEVSVTSTDVLPKQLGIAKILYKFKVQGVEKISYKSPYKILLRFKSANDVENFLKNEVLKSNPWVCRKTNEVPFSYGLVRNVDTDIAESELKHIFESYQRERSIRIYMGQNNCSYKVALRSINEHKNKMEARLQRQLITSETEAQQPSPHVFTPVNTVSPSYRDVCSGNPSVAKVNIDSNITKSAYEARGPAPATKAKNTVRKTHSKNYSNREESSDSNSDNSNVVASSLFT
ncbi:hypothetical protein ACJJTC_012844, partial [Scirpophaga incertulas]